jgi:pimeloyl-ACP methyl ester carboxylesterase
MRAWLISLLLVLPGPAFAAPDYDREKRWDAEVTPNIVVGDPVYLEQGNGHRFLGIYAEAANARMGVVVVHGLGIHPDWGLIGTLRQRLPDLGYATLSIQMPILAADARPEAYDEHFPEAVERLQLAVAYLKRRGYKRIALVSHSLGSRMSHGYMVRNPSEVSAWAALGTGSGPGPGAAITYDGIRAPVLDLYGANDLPRVLEGAAKRRASLKGKALSRQVVIPGSNHFFADREEEMLKAVKDFLDGVN